MQLGIPQFFSCLHDAIRNTPLLFHIFMVQLGVPQFFSCLHGAIRNTPVVFPCLHDTIWNTPLLFHVFMMRLGIPHFFPINTQRTNRCVNTCEKPCRFRKFSDQFVEPWQFSPYHSYSFQIFLFDHFYDIKHLEVKSESNRILFTYTKHTELLWGNINHSKHM